MSLWRQQVGGWVRGVSRCWGLALVLREGFVWWVGDRCGLARALAVPWLVGGGVGEGVSGRLEGAVWVAMRRRRWCVVMVYWGVSWRGGIVGERWQVV